ncbi:guanine deaminase [Oricola cellulosilytica]|uniref:Guanine deaminase n=1 Tax=Oricola cellulosilytica TaxID=1429082 RepID=A0A4R0PC87_9HYPH|nr:guanine deaminase [Oricola cellulosilytica]TCD15071.1 guanine deaminase [Oricola cellulosilytica]
MSAEVFRGRLLWFEREPAGSEDEDAYHYLEDGAIAVADGRIVWSGDWPDLPSAWRDAPVRDHRPHLIVPGFIDCHLHFPQGQVVASYAGSLLEWLNTYTFVEEQKYGDPDHAGRMAKAFLDMLLSHGTTTAVAFGSVHRTSAEALLGEAVKRNMRIVTGKVMMDRNAPDALTDTAQSGYEDTKALIAEWHGTGRVEVAITPRFALTSTEAQMEAAGTLAREHPECLMQTHLSENRAEIEVVAGLFPWSKDYTDVYDRYGLLSPKSLFGHCIHQSEREIARMAESRSVAVFCPTSNLFLGSGLYDLDKMKAVHPAVRHAIATDIGGGTSWSMLRTLDEGYKVLNLQGQRYHPLRSFYQATLGNAKAIGMDDRIGKLASGYEADFIVLDSRGTPAMALRAETVSTLAEELFLLQTMGDDRSVRAAIVSGATASENHVTR